MLSYVEPVPPSLKKVKLNMGSSVDEADFKKEISRSSQQHLSEHSFIINFRDGPGLKLCAESESDKFRWIKALRAAIESPKSWREFINTSNKALEEEFGIHMNVPSLYKVGRREDNFVWMDIQIPKGTMNIIAYEMPWDYFSNDSTLRVLIKPVTKKVDN